MQRFKFIGLMVMSGLLLFLSGCQKEEVYNSEEESNIFFDSKSQIAKWFPDIANVQIEIRNNNFTNNLNQIKLVLSNLDRSHKIITKIINNYGLPLWNRPLIPEEIGESEFIYYFPLFHQNNDLINGYLKVIKNSYGSFRFEIINEKQLFDKLYTDKDAEDILNHISVFSELNLKILNNTRLAYQEGIHYYISKEDERIEFRNRGCWDDKIITYIIPEGPNTIFSQTTGIFYPANNPREVSGIQIDRNNKPTFFNSAQQGGFRFQSVRIRYWNVNCDGNANDGSWVKDETGSAGNNENLSPWDNLVRNLSPWMSICNGYAPDPTGNIDNNTTNNASDIQKDDICQKIQLIQSCSSVNAEYHILLLTAIEIGRLSYSELGNTYKKHCSQPFLNEAIFKYLNFLTLPDINNNISFSQFMDAYEIIYTWMDKYKDPLSSQIGQEFINHLLIPNENIYSYLQYLNKENMDKIYIFMTNHPLLNLSFEEQWWLMSQIDEIEKLESLFNNSYSIQTANASAKIYLSLAMSDMLNLSSDDIMNNPKQMNILLFDKIGRYFNDFGLEEHNAISSTMWYTIFSRQYAFNSSAGFSDAINTAIGPGWYLFLKTGAPIINAYAQSQGYQFPQTSDQWFALGAIVGPIAIDLGTDMIPVVGEIKSFARGFNEALSGNYSGAGLEFLAALAGVIPIGKLVSRSADIFNLAKTALKALRVIKALSAFSSTIFSKIKSFINNGWEIIWDNGLNKLKFFKNQQLAGEIDQNGVQTIKTVLFRNIIDASSFTHLNPKPLVNSSSGNSISKSFINENANKFNVTEPGLKSKFDDIIDNGDQYGRKTENLIKEAIEDGGNSGWTHYDGSYGSNNGFDGVFIKGDEVIINESKQWTSGGVTLAGQGTGTPPWPAQMTDDWVRGVCNKLRGEGKGQLADKIILALESTPPKLTKIVTFVDRTVPGNTADLLGGINIIKVN